MDFYVIDLETANGDSSSICQIGIAGYENGVCVFEWGTLINPNTIFDPGNINIHGITPDMVKTAPVLPAVFQS